MNYQKFDARSINSTLFCEICGSRPELEPVDRMVGNTVMPKAFPMGASEPAISLPDGWTAHPILGRNAYTCSSACTSQFRTSGTLYKNTESKQVAKPEIDLHTEPLNYSSVQYPVQCGICLKEINERNEVVAGMEFSIFAPRSKHRELLGIPSTHRLRSKTNECPDILNWSTHLVGHLT